MKHSTELWDRTAEKKKITKQAETQSRYGSRYYQVVGIKDDECRDKCGASWCIEIKARTLYSEVKHLCLSVLWEILER